MRITIKYIPMKLIKNSLIYTPPYNKFWIKKANLFVEKFNCKIFVHKNPHLWKIKHFQMYDDIFNEINNDNYDSVLFLGPLIRPEIFFAHAQFYVDEKFNCKIIYLSMNKREELNNSITNFISNNEKIIAIDYFKILNLY